MDRVPDDVTADDVRERMKLTRASVDNQIELLRLRRHRYLAWAAVAAVASASVAAVIQLLLFRRARHAF